MKKFLITVGAILASTFTFSQDVTKFHSIFDRSRDTLKTLQDVQVIGIRPDRHDPVSITRINTSSPFTQSQQKDPFVILSQSSPSIYSQSDNGSGNGYAYMRMRGLDQTRINYSLNGVPLNEMEDQGIYFSNIPTFYNFISSIYVQRGVGTSKFGNTSVAGSINMETIDITKKSFDKNAQLLSDVPVFNTNKGNTYDAFYSSGLSKGGLGFQIGGGYLTTDGFKDHSGNDGGSFFYSFGVFKPKNIFKVYGFTGIAHNRLAFYGVPMDSINVNYKMNLNLPSDKDTFQQNFVCLNWINKGNQLIRFNTSTYYNNVKGDYNTGGILFGVNSHQFGLMSNMVYSTATNIVNVGVNTNIYSRSHFGSDSLGYYTSTLIPYTNKGYKEDLIGYVKFTKIINSVNLFLDLQSREVWFKAKTIGFSTPTYNWQFINPKIGLKIIHPKNDWFISFGNTKREPTRTDMIQNVVQTNQLYGANTDNIILLKNNTQNLNPENVYDIELGNNYHHKRLNLNFNLYGMVIKNEYVADGRIDPYSGFMVKDAVKSTLRTGIEGDGKYTSYLFWIGKFDYFWNFQYQFNQLNTGSNTQKIPFCPNLLANGGVSYTSKLGLSFGLTNQYVSSMIMNLGTTQSKSDPYFISNLFINYKLDTHTIISFKINNLFDTKYYIPAGIGYNDVNFNYHSVPTYYVGQLINWNLTIKHIM
jgi:iron complex outermembrane recepter protein